MPARALPLCLALLLGSPAVQGGGLEVFFGYSAIQRSIAEQLFFDGGRAYLHGDRSAPCAYAYLEQPRVGSNGNRLVLIARLVSRTAMEVSGACYGTDESRGDVSMSGVPTYAAGVISLTRVDVRVPGGIYAELVRGFLASAMQGVLRYPLLAETRRSLALLVPAQTGYRVDLRAFDIPSIVVERGGVRIGVRAAVEVR